MKIVWKSFRPIARILIILLACSLLAPTAGPALAQTDSSGIEMRAYPAFDGYYKYGEWLPVWVEVSNQGQDLQADVRIQVNGSTQFSVPVSLPSGSRKRFPVYILANNFSRKIEVNLISQQKRWATETIDVRPQPNITYLVGIISPQRGALTLLVGIELPDQNRPKTFTDLSLVDLPDQPEALRSFDVLILNSSDTSSLSPDQSSALESWVQNGGKLVIGGGPNAAQTLAGLPSTLKPVELHGTVEVDRPSVSALADFAHTDAILVEGPFLAAVAQPITSDNAGSQTLAGSTALPLVIQRSVGSGSVTFIAFDLSEKPFNGWTGSKQFWETLLGPGSTYPPNLPYDVSPRQMQANQLYYAISNIPALDLPSVQGLTLLLALYILIVGPANYLVLRARRKLHWAWVTIPVITVLFTAGAFGLGYAMRGNDLVLNQIAIIEMTPSGTAHVNSFLGLFSPRQQSYEITVKGDGLVSPMTGYDTNSWGPGGIVPASAEMVFVQGQPTRIQGLSIDQFSMQSFMSEDSWQNFGTISANLHMQGDALTGSVRNDTQQELQDVIVAFRTRFQHLGDLQPGQSADVDLGLANLTSDRFGPSISYLVFQDANQNNQSSREIELKTSILSSIFDNGISQRKLSSSQMPAIDSGQPIQAVVIGWINQAPPEVDVSNNLITRTTTALVYGSLDFSFSSDGIINLPVGMIAGITTLLPRDSGTCGPVDTASVHMGVGEAEFEFQIPPEILASNVRVLKLNLWQDSGDEWSSRHITLWDWNNSAWMTLQDPIQGTNVIKDAAAFVGPLGLVRVHLSSDNANYGCHYLDLGLEAEQPTSSGGLP